MTVSMNDRPLLEVRNLAVGYEARGTWPFGTRTVKAVEGVSFDIRPGETLGLVGESGSGKSTTGRAILRLLPVLEGSIRFDGQDLSDWGKQTPLSYRKQVQAVFQDPSASLNPRQLVSHAIEMTLRRHGVTKRSELHERSLAAFEMVGLSGDHLGRFPNELSGGQQQRVAIARALVLEPRLVVCDEAVSALDLSTQSQIINLLSDLQQLTGVSYLFIAHDLGVVRHIAHRVGVMNHGSLVELAETEELFASPKNAYTQRLLDATPAAHPAGREERRAHRLASRTAPAA
ncbi:ATP-binding cassette domain-containing protein [Salinibacterium sp. SYSU T00001]|uniref:ATP-binding cassette domain-containing protein n=1 Tax=Homoserinimonas sedimenticola TaxID=2986805 RepID=UPI002236083E|nr:ATP-binding cassette domain-containing protein [Salinibacterium sedimenticola]MCW4385669.1 ATP-binding cassette domain-containing protein [Salinibacterium sedimenticola]